MFLSIPCFCLGGGNNMRRYGTLHTHSESGILTITMNRPDGRNALKQLYDDEIQRRRAGSSDAK